MPPCDHTCGRPTPSRPHLYSQGAWASHLFKGTRGRPAAGFDQPLLYCHATKTPFHCVGAAADGVSLCTCPSACLGSWEQT